LEIGIPFDFASLTIGRRFCKTVLSGHRRPAADSARRSDRRAGRHRSGSGANLSPAARLGRGKELSNESLAPVGQIGPKATTGRPVPTTTVPRSIAQTTLAAARFSPQRERSTAGRLWERQSRLIPFELGGRECRIRYRRRNASPLRQHPTQAPLATPFIPDGHAGRPCGASAARRCARVAGIGNRPFSHAYADFACNSDTSAVAEFGPTK
jgi:hypothetical protein